MLRVENNLNKNGLPYVAIAESITPKLWPQSTGSAAHARVAFPGLYSIITVIVCWKPL